MRSESTRNASLAGAVASAVAASTCCIGPLAFAMLGLGGAGFLVAMEPYRPLFTVVTLGLLGVGFYTTYRPQQIETDDCDCEMPKTNRFGRWMLWGATGTAMLALVSPSVITLSTGCGVAPTTSEPTAQAAALALTTLKVEGMTCGSCEVTIRVAATKLDGVASVEVSYDKGSATVQYDPAKIEPAAVAKAISDLGYPTTILED